MFKKIYKYVRKRILKYMLEEKVKEALRLSKLENRKYIVFLWQGKPYCTPKQNLKELLKRRKFRKGTTIQDIEKQAYFITY